MRYTVYYYLNGKGGMNGKHFDKLSSAKNFSLQKHNEGYSVSLYDSWETKNKDRLLKFLK
jgi:hypothetical protein